MGIYATDLRELIIRPVLQQLNQWSPAAENLLLGTAAYESQLAFRLQNPNTTNLGLYSISPETHLNVWDNYLITDPDLASRVRGFASQQQFLKLPHHELITNLSYATSIAWMIYRSNRIQLPDEDDIYGLAKCWLHLYNTRDKHEMPSYNLQVQSIEQFETQYRKLVLREHKKIAA